METGNNQLRNEKTGAEAVTQRKVPQEIRVDWRSEFHYTDLKKGLDLMQRRKVVKAFTDESGRYLLAFVGNSQSNSKRVKIGPAPASASDTWKDCNFECECARANRRGYEWDPADGKCQHMAAALAYWEAVRGPFVFTETEEEMQARLEREKLEEEERLRREEEDRSRRRLEELKEEKSKTIVDTDVFLKENGFFPQTGTYYNVLEAAKEYKTNQYYAELAEELFDKDSILGDSGSIRYNRAGDQELSYTLRWRAPAELSEGGDDTDGEVEIRMTYHSFSRIFCSCGQTRIDPEEYYYHYGARKALCHHTLRALGALVSYIDRENPGDYTDKAAMDLFKALDSGEIEIEELTREDAAEKDPVVTVLPRITYDGISAKLSFKVGRAGKKQYVLRNLQDFVDALSSEEVFTLGKSDQINFKTMSLTPEGEKWMEFISRKVSDTQSANERLQSRRRWGYGYGTTLSIQAQEELKNALLDRFYDLMEGGSCEFQDKERGINTDMKVDHAPVRLHLTCSPLRMTDGSFAGVEVTGEMPLMLKGSQNRQQYCMTDHTLSRLTDEEREALEPFRRMAKGASGTIRFTVGKDKLQEFYYRVLPGFQESPCIDVTDNCSAEAEAVLPPKPDFTFRMDYEEGLLTLQELVRYGDTEISLPDARMIGDEESGAGDEIVSDTDGNNGTGDGAEIVSDSDGNNGTGDGDEIVSDSDGNNGTGDGDEIVSDTDGNNGTGDGDEIVSDTRGSVRTNDGNGAVSVRRGSGDGSREYRGPRDQAQEERVERAIRLFFTQYDSYEGRYTAAIDEDGMYRVLNEAVPTLSRYGKVLGTDSFNAYKMRPVPQVRVGVSIESGLLDLNVLSKDVDVEELLELMDSYRRRKRYHRLRSGEFVALTSQEQTKSLAELSRIIEELDLSEKDVRTGHTKMPMYRALYLNRLLEEHDALAGSRDRHFRQLIRDIRTISDSEFEPPREMADTLRPYQTYGYKWLRTLHEFGFGGILADEMGLGKTLQMISVFDALKKERKGSAEENAGQAADMNLNSEHRSAEVLHSGSGTAEALNGGSGSAGVLKAVQGTAEILDAKRGSAEVLKAEQGSAEILDAERGSAKALNPASGSAEALNAERGSSGIHLVVCPASLVYNWQEEIERFAPDLNAQVVAGTAAVRKKILSSADTPDVYITSYDLLKKDIVLYEKLHFDIAVLDEAQFIKNQKAAVTKAVKGIRADHRFALTGTPIENRLAELWSIFDFLMPGYLYNYETFSRRFETPIVKQKDEESAARLKKMVGPFILRRLKGDVLKDLPEKLEEVRYARLEEEQRKLYDAQVVRMREMISGADGNSGEDKIRIFAELTRIRQICCDPSLLFENYRGTSAKREACIELIKSAIDGGHRMLVFSQFTSMLSLLEKDLVREGIAYYTITGATPKEQRVKLMHQFNEEEEVPVFLISLKAGGTGLNLVGADVVIHYDPWWNLAVQNQATDRAHRIGQTRQVSVFKLIGKDTIEEKIVELQNAKKDLADAILSGENQSLMSLSKEELLSLLE